MVMRGPAGEEQVIESVFLEVTPRERVVFTDAFSVGWVPKAPFMVGLFTFAEEEGGTRYVATARHWSEEAMASHKAMGFEPGWNAVADQLEAVAKRIAAAD